MFTLGKHGPDGRFGVVCDVASASVAVAIVAADPTLKQPVIVWTHVERCATTDADDIHTLAKKIATAAVNAFMELGASGLTALAAYDSSARIADCQISIGAPWSYTTTQTVTQTHDAPVDVSETLIHDLVVQAEEKAVAAVGAQELFEQLGLEIIRKETTQIELNGYVTHDPYDKTADHIAVTRKIEVSQKNIINALRESMENTITKATPMFTTYMSILHQAATASGADSALTLLDFSGEAIEVAATQQGSITSVIHDPWGHHAIVRAYANSQNIPTVEAIGILKEANYATPSAELLQVLDPFIEQAVIVLKRLQTASAIAPHMYLHADTGFDPLAHYIIEKAALRAQIPNVEIHTFTELQQAFKGLTETKLAIAAAVFHIQAAHN